MASKDHLTQRRGGAKKKSNVWTAVCVLSEFLCAFAPLREHPSLAVEPLVRLTIDGHLKQRPAWSPDGGSLAFTRHQGATIFLYLRAADGSQEKRLTTRDAPECDAVWS